MCTTVSPAKTQVLATNKSGSLFYPTGGWVPAISVYKIKALTTLVNPTSNFRVAPAYQTATTDTKTPDSATQIGATWVSTETTTCEGWTDISSSIAAKMWIRFGVIIQDTAAQEGDVLKKGEVTSSVATKDHA